MTTEQSFRELLAFTWTHSRLYRRLYSQRGIREEDLPHVRLEDLPVVSKPDIMEHFDEAVTDPRLRIGPLTTWLQEHTSPLDLYLDEYIVIHSTGGSPTRSVIPCSPHTWRRMTTTAVSGVLPVDPATRGPLRSAFYFLSAGHFVSSTNASLASQFAHQVLWLSLYDPLEEVWAKLNAFKPEHLSSYASTAAWLAGWTLEGKLRIRPRSVLVSGDRLEPHVRAVIEEAWGAEIYDLYAATESPYMAVRKPGDVHSRVFRDLNILEVIDASHHMVSPGERGRVVVTNLVNKTLPLIRFDLHDDAILGKSGFGAETLERIEGKASIRLPVRAAGGDIMTLPLHVLDRLCVEGGVTIQFISHGPDEVEIHYVAHENIGAQIDREFRALLNSVSATVRSLHIERVAFIPNDLGTAKYWKVITPDRPALSPVRLSDGRYAVQGFPSVAENAGLPFSAEGPSRSVFLRFREIAVSYPDYRAVTDGERHLTYEECYRAAQRIAQGLLRRDFDPGRPVAVLPGHRPEMIPLLLGVLGAGGFYLPLDPYVPMERLRKILSDTRPEYILTVAEYGELAREVSENAAAVLQLEEFLAAGSPEMKLPDLSAETPACLLFTSGSTGVPKGVVFSHRTVLQRVQFYTRDFLLRPDDHISLLQSYAVSAGVRDIFGALLNGATLAMYDIRARGVQALPDWVKRNGISVLYAVPTVWRLFLGVLSDERFSSVRVVRLGGEAVESRDLDGFKVYFPAGCRLVNGYAATETDTICQYWMDHETRLVGGRVPVGMPVTGTSVRILDESGDAVTGAIGEIVFEGETMANGYWDSAVSQVVLLEGRAFAIGDLGYRLPDGRIFLTGRRDFVLNVHGYRIDLGEIEDVLSGLDGVNEAVAVARRNRWDDVDIAVYYVPAEDRAIPLEKLRRAVATVLPGPSLPVFFTPLAVLPRLPGGKVNRNILANLPRVLPSEGGEVLQRSGTEARLAGIWREILGVRNVPSEADFLALGGDSITAFRVVSRIRTEFNVEVPISEFFHHSTLPELTRFIDRQCSGDEGKL